MGALEKIDHALQRLFRWNLRQMIELSIPKMNRLRFQGRWEKALEILQNILEIEETDYEDPRRVFRKLRDRLSVVDPSMAVVFLIQYLNVLADSGRQALVPVLLELDAGIGPEDYADPQRISSLLQQRLAGVDSAQGFFYGAIFASTLGESDRPADALAVSQALLGDPAASIEAPFRLRPKPEEVDLSSWWGAAATVSTFLLQTGRWSEAVSLLGDVYRNLEALPEGEDQEISPFEQWRLLLPMGMFLLGSPEGWSEFERLVGFEPDDYQDEARLASKLRALTAEIPPDFGANMIAMWLLALAELRPEDALAVLRVDAGLTPSDWRDPERLALRLQERCRNMPADTTGRYLLSAAAALSGSSHPALAAVALEADADLTAVDWVDGKELAARLDQRMAGLAGTTRLGYLDRLVSALVHADREEKGALLADAYVRGLSPLVGGDEGPFLAPMSCRLFDRWLQWWGRDAGHQPLEICHALLPYLRRSLADQGVALSDRSLFIRSVGDLRHRTVQTGLYWAAHEREPERARELRRTVLLWDLELAQRLILERFLLAEIHPTPAGEPIPAGVWPLGELPPATENYLPDFLEVPAMTGILEGTSTSQPSSPLEETAARSPFASRFEDLAQRGLDEAGVAGALGPKALLLRVTFDPEGRLVWGALKSDGPRLSLAGFGAGEPGDLQRLRWATARHDFSMGLLHWMTNRRKLPPLRSAAREAFLAALRDLAESAEPGARVEEVAKALSDRFSEKVSASILRLFQVLTWPLAAEGSDPVAAQELRTAENFVSGIDQQPGLREALDAVTADYLRQVTEIWKLSSLDASLTPDTDLVIQGDDALHAVPVAWLSLGGPPLYRRVRTVRASLAPQLDALLEEIDHHGSAGPDERRLLSVSYFGREDPAREGARWLHHGHLRLAERFHAVSVAGADEKTGNVGSIRAALEQYRSFATVAICGHGDFEQAGIQLGGEGGETVLWQGQGCDLSRVDWLLLVSCSIGRASRTGDLDVEGFCVQLAVHRARSILACRWPVLSVEAAAFANEAVRQYLELEGQPERRARALTAARQAVCEGERPLVGLNTAAAFELYGLG